MTLTQENAHKTKLTFMQALRYVLGGLPAIQMDQTTLVVGNARLYARICLAMGSTHGNYTQLEVEIFIGGVLATSYRLHLTDASYAPPNTLENVDRGHDGGGYFWTHDHMFYNYAPVPAAVRRDVENILTFHEVPR